MPPQEKFLLEVLSKVEYAITLHAALERRQQSHHGPHRSDPDFDRLRRPHDHRPLDALALWVLQPDAG